MTRTSETKVVYTWTCDICQAPTTNHVDTTVLEFKPSERPQLFLCIEDDGERLLADLCFPCRQGLEDIITHLSSRTK